MAILQTGTTYSDGNQVTSTNLNAAVNAATFVSGAVDNVTTQLSGSGQIIVKDGGITAAKLGTAENNQLFIGNGTGFTKKLLSAGDGITLTVDADSIDISSTGSIGGTSGSTDNAIILADGVDTNEIKSSSITIDGSNNIAGANNITAGGLVNVASASGYQVNGTKVLGAQGGAIISITTPVTNFDLSDLNDFVFDMNDKTNEILAALRTHGIIAT